MIESQEPMGKRIDLIYEYKPPYSGVIAKCRLRVFDDRYGATVIITELDDNPGVSITNACDYIATQTVLDFDIEPESTRFIEHYPKRVYEVHGRTKVEEATYDEIFFEWSERNKADEPSWRRIKDEDWEELKTLIGDELE